MNNQPPNLPGRRYSSNEIQHRDESEMSETIIADSAFGQEELIEIEISEEFREMNLNGPGDSEMLEICLSDPNQIERKESNINFEPRDQIKLIDQPNGRLETPATTSRTFEVYNTPQYIPTQSLSPEELQPSTSRHCRETSRSSEVYKQPQSISQLLPIQNLSLDELQPSTSKHCSTNSKTCEDYKQPQSTSQYISTHSLSPEELQPSTSRHCREISMSSEVYKQPQYTQTRLSLSPEELQPSTSKHCRPLISKNAKDLNKIGKKIKKPRSPQNIITRIEPIRERYTTMGPNRTLIETSVFDQIPWDNPSAATRRLMSALFSRETLATHSLTARPSPVFKNKRISSMLDQRRIEDIIYIVSRKCGVTEKEVRNIISTKCADEKKIKKLIENKNKAQADKNRENEDT